MVRRGYSLARIMLAVLTLAAAASAKETAEVTITYMLAPGRPMPDGLKAVAVIDSGVETRGAKEDDRERKWSAMAADMIEQMLASNAAKFGAGLQVAQRRMTRQILAEQDLKLAGLVDAPNAERAGKLLDVQGLITSQITINIDMERTRKSTIDWASLMGAASQAMLNRNNPPPPPPRAVVVQPAPQPIYGRPTYMRQNRSPDGRVRDPRLVDPRLQRSQRYTYDPRYRPRTAPPGAVVRPGQPVVVAPAPAPAPPPQPLTGVGMKEVEEVSRRLTVQCSFTLVDAVTGQALLIYKPPAYQKLDKASPDFIFGGVQSAKLDPVDHFIGELVERAVQEFVSLMVPTEVEYRYELLGKHKAGEAGIRALRADDYEMAFAQFQKEATKYDDEPQPLFALGVISELMGRPEEALKFYRQAAASKDAEGEELQMYLAAKKRLDEHMGRILKAPPPTAGTPPPDGGGIAPPPGNAPPPPPPGEQPPAGSSRRKSTGGDAGFGFTQ